MCWTIRTAWRILKELEAALGLADVSDCFRRYVVSDDMAAFFGIDTVEAWEVDAVGARLSFANGDVVTLTPLDEADLLWGGLPMGFS